MKPDALHTTIGPSQNPTPCLALLEGTHADQYPAHKYRTHHRHSTIQMRKTQSHWHVVTHGGKAGDTGGGTIVVRRPCLGAAHHQLGWHCRRPSPIRRPRLGPHALTWGSAVVTCRLTLPGAAQFHMGWHPRRPSPLPAACHHPLPVCCPRLGLHAVTWGGTLVARCPAGGCMSSPRVAPSSPVTCPLPSPGVACPHLGQMRQPPSKGASP
jgi:hypothetical protein